MTDQAILAQACRNVLPHEWPSTFRLCGAYDTALVAHRHLQNWPNGSVARNIRREYLRLLGEAAP